MIDYNDPLAIQDAYNAMCKEIEDAQRGTSEWMRQTMPFMMIEMIAVLQEEPDFQFGLQKVMSSCLLMGYIAGQEGWPLVGDRIEVKEA